MLITFLNDNRGSFALKFGLCSTLLLLGLGVAVDSARLVKAKQELQNASDAATLSAALAYKQSSNDQLGKARTDGRSSFEVNTEHMNYAKEKISFELTDQNSIRSTVDISLKPMFINLFGYPKLDLTVNSEVAVGTQIGAEIVLAVDSTNSMAFGSQWDTVMETIETTLEELEDFTGDDNIYVSVVPFKDRVNIGTARAAWLDGGTPADWNGCVEPREEDIAGFEFMLTDERPNTGPFEANIPGTSGWGSTLCPEDPILGPSNDIDDLLEDTSNYTTGGTGRFDSGLAWAWRLLSPEWSGQWGVSNYPAVNSKTRKKYLIFMSDGKSTAFEKEHAQERTWGWNEGSQPAFEHIVEICDQIKADDIEIYGLRFGGNDHFTPYMKACASSEAHYFEVNDVSDITYPFNKILSDFSGEIRVMR